MYTLVIVLLIQLCNLANLWTSVGVIVVNSSHSHQQDQSKDRHFRKHEKPLQNNKSDITGNHKRKDVFPNDFVIDGLDEFIDNLNSYGEFEKDSESYSPSFSDIFILPNNERIDHKGTRHDPDSLSLASKEDRHRMGDIITDYMYGSFFPDSDGAISNRGLDHYDDVYDINCPEGCLCEGTYLLCVGKNLTAVPEGISPLTTWIDLSMNSIKALPDDSFAHLPNLKELSCMGNILTDLPPRLFKHNRFLQILNFQGNLFQTVPARAFQNLQYLLELHLDANEITTIPKNAFSGLSNLKHVWLDDNILDSVPTKAFRALSGLEALTLIKNRITHLPDYAFRNNTKLIHLALANNSINHIADNAFYGLTKLKHLKLQQNKLTTVPSAFSHLVSLEELNLNDNLLTHILDKSFLMKSKLTKLSLDNNPITFVGQEAFKNLPSLQEIKLSSVHDMHNFPDFEGTENLTSLQMDRSQIKSIPEDLCKKLKKLKRLDLHGNKIGTLPKMSQCKSLTILDLATNELMSLEGQLFDGMDRLKDLTLFVNFIEIITDDTFVGLSALEYLDLSKNRIREIHPNAFLPIKSLKELNLAENYFQHLPTAGLINLERLIVINTPALQEFPSHEHFPKVRYFGMSYAYHCCDFIQTRTEEADDATNQLSILDDPTNIPGHTNFTSEIIDFLRSLGDNGSEHLELHFENITVDADHWKSISHDSIGILDSLSAGTTKYQRDTVRSIHQADDHNRAFSKPKFTISKSGISCKPLPGPFQPCDDLFDWWSLRCGIWLVFMLALLGNGAVFFVSVTSKSKMDVTRFLICNLAVADFFMGIYLGILATMDASTFGHFRKYGIKWQRSTGCLVAGTLGVLSSELSVFTLTVITLERFYAITHAMQLNKRLSLKRAGFIMLGGWLWSFSLAIQPLFGISDYRKFAVCLPFEIEDPVSKSYVCFLLIVNGIAFLIIMSCYLIMYISIRRSQSWNSSDTRVAKRMALLVFTDLLCWAPIAVLSLAAAFGKNLVHLDVAKVLTIFVLPLNSCANPFLYAFFTKQFKKDCVFLCRRLEGSLAKHFSQAARRHVSLSWKYHLQHPSTLQSLAGESKTNNSRNHSSGSNSFGLLNCNSEISTGTSKALGQEAIKFDGYRTGSQTYSTTSSDDNINCRTKHKYTPCSCDDSEDRTKIMNNALTDVHKCEDNYYVQVTRDQNVPNRRETAKDDGRFAETDASDDHDHSNFSSDDNLNEDNMKSYRHQQFAREVTQDDDNATGTETHTRRNRSPQNCTAELMGRSHYRENKVYINIEQFNQISDSNLWQVNGFHNGYKDIKLINSNNETFTLIKSREGSTSENNICKKTSDLNPTKRSMDEANDVYYDRNNGKKQKTQNVQNTLEDKGKDLLNQSANMSRQM